MSKELVNALDALEQEKGIKAEVLVEAIEEALNKAYEIGDEIRFEVTPADFGRLAAQTAKQ
ncbi:MAG TPA: transcription termination/antitermination protein NusA, partial [Weissella cibaria]|nr:transcription termination/antitermination protein NusA [Weissella cibaria]